MLDCQRGLGAEVPGVCELLAHQDGLDLLVQLFGCGRRSRSGLYRGGYRACLLQGVGWLWSLCWLRRGMFGTIRFQLLMLLEV